MKYVVIGTAGHIDHGKTTLIKAITGIDTDRLPEEKKRGITIDLGFAHYQLTPRLNVSFVDVPGHERLVKNMIAGACGIDMVLLVVAADEGVMPQTVEHANICRILGIRKGVVAVTKKDLVDEELLQMVKEEVSEFLRERNIFEDPPIVAVSAKTGEGIQELIEAIESVALSISKETEESPFRLPVDRVFTVKGFGTVVTGTVFSGKTALGDELEVLPQRKQVKVRNIQFQGKDVKTIEAGRRCALNLHGIEKNEIERGNIIATPGAFPVSDMLDAKIFVLQDSSYAIKDLQPVRVHIATKEVIARIKLLEKEELKPGEETFCRLHLEEVVSAANLEPVVIRSYSPVTTIAGGIILDACPDRRKIKRAELLKRLKELENANDEKRIELFTLWNPDGIEINRLRIKAKNPLKADGLIKKLSQAGKVIVLSQKTVLHKENAEKLREKLKKLVSEFLDKNPLKKGLPLAQAASSLWKHEPAQLEELISAWPEFSVNEGFISLKTRKSVLDEETQRLISLTEKVFERSGLTPPKLNDVAQKIKTDEAKLREIIQYLLDQGKLVKVSSEIIVHKKHIDRMVKKINEFFETKKDLTVGEFKDMFGLTRKYAIPYLEFLDRVGVTKRVGNIRRKR